MNENLIFSRYAIYFPFSGRFNCPKTPFDQISAVLVGKRQSIDWLRWQPLEKPNQIKPSQVFANQIRDKSISPRIYRIYIICKHSHSKSIRNACLVVGRINFSFHLRFIAYYNWTYAKFWLRTTCPSHHHHPQSTTSSALCSSTPYVSGERERSTWKIQFKWETENRNRVSTAWFGSVTLANSVVLVRLSAPCSEQNKWIWICGALVPMCSKCYAKYRTKTRQSLATFKHLQLNNLSFEHLCFVCIKHIPRSLGPSMSMYVRLGDVASCSILTWTAVEMNFSVSEQQRTTRFT